MSTESSRVQRDREALEQTKNKGLLATLVTFARLSGPGWLQSAITLGGGSLAGGLFLGVLAGYEMMWLQPLAMILGVVMLSAIGYVTLSTGQRPLGLINREVSPVLGWGWAIATLMANLVWCMPQFALGVAALRQNLLPGSLGADTMSDNTGTWIAVAILAVPALAAVISYETGGRGIKIFENFLKVLIGIIVLCFFGVVFKLSGVEGGIEWGEVLSGFVPRPDLFFSPATAFREVLQEAGEYATFWSDRIVLDQRNVMITAAATAVGINMTFLLPYSLLDRGWDRKFRGMATFDLSIGLFIPFMLATSCVVMASASRFHAQYNEALVSTTPATSKALAEVANGSTVKNYLGALDTRLNLEYGADVVAGWSPGELAQNRDSLPMADRTLAAMLVRRDAFDLANALKPLAGEKFAQYVFGFGVVAMALSTIVVLMLINGFVVCEMLGKPAKGGIHFLGALLALGVGALGPFVFQGEAKFWLAVPTSVFGMILLPVAYCTFFFLMNSRRVLGDDMPRGGVRILVNLLMGTAVALATLGASWSIWSKAMPLFGIPWLQVRYVAIAVVVVFVLLALVIKPKRSET